MPYTALNPADIVAGKPTKEEIFQQIRDNQESFNTDIEALKQTAQIDIIDVHIAGYIGQYTEAEATRKLPVFRAPVAGSIIDVKMALLEVSSSGTIELEIDKSTDDGVNWDELLSSPIELTGTTVGSISGSVNFINQAAQDFNQNDLIRIRITGVQVNQGRFHVSVYGVVA